ncbi:hypothetical protein N9934_02715 [Desulfosarcina sp.]|nr:hypothetical protein [Desulfosarcina sp.]
MIFSSSLRTSILLLLSFISFLGYSQINVEKNKHVIYEIDLDEGVYEVRYVFLDPFGTLQTYKFSIPAESTHQMIDKFGVPRWLFEPYEDTEHNREVRIIELEKGFFKLNGNTIIVDKSAVIDFYGPSFCKPIAEMIVSSLSKYGMDNRRNRIEFAMRFVQDIPYGIPQYESNQRHYGGVNIIPNLLISGFGDCDSKVLLFAGIITYLIPTEDFIFLNQPKHVLSAIKGVPENGQTFIRYSGDKYLLAETAGPGKRSLGEEGKYYRNTFTTERLKINPTEIIPFSNNNYTSSYTSTQTNIDPNSIKINNDSEREFRFQVSYDKISWDSMTLEPNQTGNVNFDTSSKKYLRYRLNNSDFLTVEVYPGQDYTFLWKNRKKKWEIIY